MKELKVTMENKENLKEYFSRIQAPLIPLTKVMNLVNPNSESCEIIGESRYQVFRIELDEDLYTTGPSIVAPTNYRKS